MWLPKEPKRSKLWLPHLWLPFASEIQFYDDKILFGDSEGNNTDKVAFHARCCCDCLQPCACCLRGATEEIRLTISGIGEDGCGSCGSLNAVFILAWFNEVGNNCVWKYILPAEICGIAYITGGIYCGGVDEWEVFAALYSSNDVLRALYHDLLYSKLDCCTLDKTLTYDHGVGIVGCDETTGTVHYEAIPD